MTDTADPRAALAELIDRAIAAKAADAHAESDPPAPGVPAAPRAFRFSERWRDYVAG